MSDVLQKLLDVAFDERRFGTLAMACVVASACEWLWPGSLTAGDRLVVGLHVGAVVFTIAWLARRIANSRRRAAARRCQIAALESLDGNEWGVIREFFDANKNVLELPRDCDAIVGLINQGVLIQADHAGRYGRWRGELRPLFRFRLVDWARELAAYTIHSEREQQYKNG